MSRGLNWLQALAGGQALAGYPASVKVVDGTLGERAARYIAVVPDAENPFPRARNPSYKVRVDFGDGGERWSSAQITNYSEAELLGRLVVCVVNMPPRNIAGFKSEILVMGAPDAQGRTMLLQPDAGADRKSVV